MNIKALLNDKIKKALINAGLSVDFEPQLRKSSKLQFGDYQANGVMAIAKKLNIPPLKLAEKILENLDLKGIANKVEIGGPGFINIFIDPVFLADNVEAALKSSRLNIAKQKKTQTIVIDYSSPNVAKEMHVGHLRSTIIGDVTARTLEFLGHTVIRANHIGDWGTQFGMLLAYIETNKNINLEHITLTDLENFYREAKKIFIKNKSFAELARCYVVKLQSGDKYCSKIWQKLVDITISHNQIIYERLNVTLTRNDIMGESIYNNMLPVIVADLKTKGLAIDNENSTVVMLNEFKNKKNKPMGVIIQKKDGGYLYTTTEIACAKYRYETLNADRVLYYIDSRQHQHLMQIWTIVRKAGYVPDLVKLEHHMFGMMLGKNGKPFKTCAGGTVKLSALLDEAFKRAYNIIAKNNPNMPDDEITKLANIIGIGALKYADLSKNRTTDYIFDWDQMLKFEGNTAPYLQYAYIRIKSVFRKANIKNNVLFNAKVIIAENIEAKLAVLLLQLEDTLNLVARDGTPHVMCNYLYDIACLFSYFYEKIPILTAKNEDIRNSRLKLALLTANTLKLGLNILGIETVDRM